jgi:hypothetical protein
VACLPNCKEQNTGKIAFMVELQNILFGTTACQAGNLNGRQVQQAMIGLFNFAPPDNPGSAKPEASGC